MKLAIKFFTAICLFLVVLQSCELQDEDDLSLPKDLEINDFVWRGLNLYYLWQSEVPNLADDKFKTQNSKIEFLRQYNTPESLFDALRVSKKLDRFSWIQNDYEELEGLLQGVTKNNGVEFQLSRLSNDSKRIIGWVKYIIPGSDAANKDIKRGDLFYAVDGVELTTENYRNLLFGENIAYTFGMASITNNTLSPTTKTVSLTKATLEENPILVNKVIPVGSNKIGYLMYNGFYGEYDDELNAAFGQLKSGGVTDLVLDLRYNGGGSVISATRLASMITGNYVGQLFAKQQWNSKIEEYFAANEPNANKNFFVDKIDNTPINSLNLNTVYILTTESSASASELVINGLTPYINVVQIGDKTTGKNVGSITIYDSPDFTKRKVNKNHKYAMQPIVVKTVNKNGFGDYQDGLIPNFTFIESISNLGVLGSPSEPLLALAISKITGNAPIAKTSKPMHLQTVTDSKTERGLNEMYIDKIPKGLAQALKQ